MINNPKQYEANNLTASNKKELLRALFDAYKSRVASKLGFNNLETVMNDRLMSFKNLTKKELEHSLFSFLFLIIATYLIFINMLQISTTFFLLLAFIFGVLFSFFKIFLLKNISPLKNEIHTIAFKKVLYDVYFETLTSVQLVYYVFVFSILLLFLGVILLFNIDTFYMVDVIIYKMSQKLGVVPFNFFVLIKDILLSYLFFVVGSYLYIFFTIFVKLKKILKKYQNDNK